VRWTVAGAIFGLRGGAGRLGFGMTSTGSAGFGGVGAATAAGANAATGAGVTLELQRALSSL
jgi:hypothetical protein